MAESPHANSKKAMEPFPLHLHRVDIDTLREIAQTRGDKGMDVLQWAAEILGLLAADYRRIQREAQGRRR
jgi:hypothetical protein